MSLIRWSTLALLAALAGWAGCAPDDETAAHLPPMETHADTVAMRAYEAVGGPEAWASLPYLRFDFGIEQNDERQVRRRHLWNRHTGDYRLEWTTGDDSSYVVLFNVNSREGQAYLNGTPVDSARNDQLLQQAYRGFINDTYWMLAPTKMLDPGVQRTYMPDSSTAETEAIMLTFDSVGLTPGDRYWMYVDKETGRMKRWAFQLEGGNRGNAEWTGYQGLEAPAGSVYVATRKQAKDSPVALLTDNVAAPSSVPDSLFTVPRPLLD